MIKSPVKFDDLAFILLFFFMIIAVISFSETLKVDSSQSSKAEDVQSLSLFLDENGMLSKDGSPFNLSDLSQEDIIDLSIAESVSWEIISQTIIEINRTGASVSLVIK